jgi:hypothetical protein
MINITKTQPGPAQLATATTHNIPEVVMLVSEDFHHKCYICERKNPSSIQIEHFVAHQGNKALQLDWDNLFFACGHCNNIKGHYYNNILNCTVPADNIEAFISFKLSPFPKEVPEFTAIDTTQRTLDTVKLLNSVYNGTTFQKRLEASYLRQSLLDDSLGFTTLINEYFKSSVTNYKNSLLLKIETELHASSAYTAFKRRYVKDKYMAEFGHFLP